MIINKIRKRWNCGQGMLEFAALLMIVIGALIAGQVYFKRGIQGRWKAAVDEISDELYDPRYGDSDVVHSLAANSVVEITTLDDGSGFWTIRQDYTNTISSRSGQSLVGGY